MSSSVKAEGLPGGPSADGEHAGTGGGQLLLNPDFETIFERLPAAVVVVDGPAVLFANRAFERMTGFTRAQVLEPGFLQARLHPEDREIVRAHGEARARGDSAPARYAARLIAADGVERWHELSAEVIDHEGRKATLLVVRDVTEERAAAAAIAASEARFRGVVDTVTIGLLLWDGQHPVMANAEAERITGYSQAELQRPGFLASIIHPDDVTLVRERTMEGHASGDTPPRYPIRFYRSDGELRWVEMGAFTLITETGYRNLVAVRDITDQKRSEDALRESEALFRALVDTVPVGIFLWDGSDVLFANEALQRMTGYNRGQLMEHGFLHGAWHPDDHEHLHLRGEARLSGGPVPPTTEARFIRPDGEVRWFELSARRVGHSGDPQTLVAVRDITETKQASQALRESEARFGTIFHSSPVATSLFSLETARIVDANSACEELFGMSAEEFVDRDAAAIGIGHDGPGLRDLLKAGETIVNHPTHVTTPGRTIDVLLSAEPIMVGEGHCALVMMTDISVLRRAEEERREFEARMQQTQKLESLGILAGGIAHDFNNLLMGVLGNAGLALMELQPESPARQTIRDIETAAMRAAELTRQMLAYSGKGAFVVEPLDLARLVEEMAHLLRAAIPSRCRVEYHFATDLPPIEGDATQVRQVAMNLITNAADAIGEREGVITVSTGRTWANAAMLRDSYLAEPLPEGEYIYLDVADSGEGMDAETKARIFDPFFTTKFTGRGLGLAAVLGIVRGHRAAIKVDSEVGSGSRFRVLFPRAVKAHTPAVDAESAAPGSPWRGSGLLLVIDDDDTVRAVTKLMLERSGFSVLAARDGAEGIALFAQHADAVRAVVLDMTMPRMDGEATFRALRAVEPEARVILSSGYAEHEATGAFATGALSGFIQKPYSAEELLATVRNALTV